MQSERFEIGQFERLPRPPAAASRQKEALATPHRRRSARPAAPCSPRSSPTVRRQCSGQALEACSRPSAANPSLE